MTERGLFTGEEMRELLKELADELPDDGRRRRVVVVGGAKMAWNDLRESTRDVDSALWLDAATKIAIAVVAARHGLRDDWLNDAAAGSVPFGFNPTAGTVVLDHSRLEVIEAAADQVFLMKLDAGRSADFDDLQALWPLTDFGTMKDALVAYEEAYPAGYEDPNLRQYLRSIVDE